MRNNAYPWLFILFSLNFNRHPPLSEKIAQAPTEVLWIRAESNNSERSLTVPVTVKTIILIIIVHPRVLYIKICICFYYFETRITGFFVYPYLVAGTDRRDFSSVSTVLLFVFNLSYCNPMFFEENKIRSTSRLFFNRMTGFTSNV